MIVSALVPLFINITKIIRLGMITKPFIVYLKNLLLFSVTSLYREKI